MAEKIGEIKQKLEETDISLLPAFVEQYKTDARKNLYRLPGSVTRSCKMRLRARKH